MFCRFCGNQINDNDKFCSNCGHEINPVETKIVVKEDIIKERGPWRGFAIAGFVLGIVSISLWYANAFGVFLAILGIIFSALGGKSISKKRKAKAGLILSIIATSLAFVFSSNILQDFIDRIVNIIN